MVKTHEEGGNALDAETFYSVLVVTQGLRKAFMRHSLTTREVKFVETRQIFRDLF